VEGGEGLTSGSCLTGLCLWNCVCNIALPAGTKQTRFAQNLHGPAQVCVGLCWTAAKSILPLIAFRRRTESSGTNETILSFGILHLCRPGISRGKTSRGVVFLC